MNQENKYNSRSGFLKKLPLVLVSFFGLGAAMISIQKIKGFFDYRVSILSDNEIPGQIRRIHSKETQKIKPLPPPKFSGDRQENL